MKAVDYECDWKTLTQDKEHEHLDQIPICEMEQKALFLTYRYPSVSTAAPVQNDCIHHDGNLIYTDAWDARIWRFGRLCYTDNIESFH